MFCNNGSSIWIFDLWGWDSPCWSHIATAGHSFELNVQYIYNISRGTGYLRLFEANYNLSFIWMFSQKCVLSCLWLCHGGTIFVLNIHLILSYTLVICIVTLDVHIVHPLVIITNFQGDWSVNLKLSIAGRAFPWRRLSNWKFMAPLSSKF